MIKNFIAEIIHVTKRLKARSIEVEEELVTKTLGSENLLADKDLIVNENSNLKGNVDIGKNLTVKGTSTLKDNVTMEKALTANGDMVIGGTSTLKNNVVAEKTLAVNGTSTLKDDVTAEKTLTVNGTSTLKGDITAEKNVLTKGNFTVNGTSTLKDNATMEKTLTVNGTSTLKDNVTVNKSLTVKGDISVSGKISGVGFSGGEILSGGNDYAGLDKYNNIAIKSWWGISFSTLCAGQKFSSTPAVSIDCRDGHIYAGGNLNVSGSINVAYPHSIVVRHVDSPNNGDLYLNYNNSSDQKRVYFGTGNHCIRSNGAYYTGKSEDSYHLEGKGLTKNSAPWNGIPVVGDDGVMDIGRYIDFHTQNVNKDYDGRLEYNENGLVLNGHVIMTPSGIINDPIYYKYKGHASSDCWYEGGSYTLVNFADNNPHFTGMGSNDSYMALVLVVGCSSSETACGADDRGNYYLIYEKMGSSKENATWSYRPQVLSLSSFGSASRYSIVTANDSHYVEVKIPKGNYVYWYVWLLSSREGGLEK